MNTYYKAERPGLFPCDHKHTTIAAAQRCGGQKAKVLRCDAITRWLVPVTADDRKAEEVRKESKGLYVYEE